MDLFEPNTLVGQRLQDSSSYGYVYTFRDADNRVIQYNISDTSKIVDGMYTTGYNCSYPYTASFEENFDTYYYIHLVLSTRWMAKYFMVVYLTGIYTLKRVMATRAPFNLRTPLVFWNLSLALLSLLGGIRCLQELIPVIYNYGFTFSACYAGKA